MDFLFRVFCLICLIILGACIVVAYIAGGAITIPLTLVVGLLWGLLHRD